MCKLGLPGERAEKLPIILVRINGKLRRTEGMKFMMPKFNDGLCPGKIEELLNSCDKRFHTFAQGI